ncbi:MAG: hypothetical protein ACRDT0_13095 [Pseudonocardiaceae bacterium]
MTHTPIFEELCQEHAQAGRARPAGGSTAAADEDRAGDEVAAADEPDGDWIARKSGWHRRQDQS